MRPEKCRGAKLDATSWWGLITIALFYTQPGVFLESFLLGWLFLALMFLDPIILQALLAAATHAPNAQTPSNYTLPLLAASIEAGGPSNDGDAEGRGLWYRFALVGGKRAAGLFALSTQPRRRCLTCRLCVSMLVGVGVALSLSMLVRVTCMELCYFSSVRACNNARSTLVMAIFQSTLASSAPANDTGALCSLEGRGGQRERERDRDRDRGCAEG